MLIRTYTCTHAHRQAHRHMHMCFVFSLFLFLYPSLSVSQMMGSGERISKFLLKNYNWTFFSGTHNLSYLTPNLKTHHPLILPCITVPFFFFFFWYWCTVDLQYCVSFKCKAKTVILPWIPLSPCRREQISQDGGVQALSLHILQIVTINSWNHL